MSDETLQASTKPQIAFGDFTKLDLRVATVTAAEPHPNADKLIKIRLDDGSGRPRQVCAGIKAWYEPQDLVGKQVVIVANLEPRKLRGEMSEGMVLCATIGAGKALDDVVLLTLDKPVPAGAAVS